MAVMAPDNEPGAGPIQGVGIGLRTTHYRDIAEGKPDIPWLEVLTDNYLAEGGQPLRWLEALRGDYPVTCHGVGMSLGSVDPLNLQYLDRVKRFAQRFEPAWVSDHLCWNAYRRNYSHELLPMPYTEEAVRHMAQRITQAQDYLGRRLVIENVSTYVDFADSMMSEWEFLIAVTSEADCDILLDINNIYVSARNQRFDPVDYLDAIPPQRVREIHLAGYEDMGTHLLDTHGQPVHPPVWDLYRQAMHRFASVPTLIEWDTDIPALPVVLAEADKARAIRQAGGHDDAA